MRSRERVGVHSSCQSVQRHHRFVRAIRSTADVRLFGAPGTVAKFAARLGGNNMHDTPTTTIISGHRMRTESGNTATIIDADAGRIITIDTKEQTDTFITFDEMAAAMRRAEIGRAHV